MEAGYKKIRLFWSHDNPGVFKFMVCKAVIDSLAQYGRGNVCLTLFGPTVLMAAEQEAIKKPLQEFMAEGMRLVACEKSVELYQVREQIEAIGGVEIKKIAKRAVDDALPDEKMIFL